MNREKRNGISRQKKNVEKTSCFTVFYTKFFPIVRIKKNGKIKNYGIRLKSDLVFMKKKKIKREEKLQISFETEHLPPSTKNGSSVP